MGRNDSGAAFPSNEWALILGGSSGFGLATARRLARGGLNVLIVHRDRRGAMKAIQPHFDELAEICSSNGQATFARRDKSRACPRSLRERSTPILIRSGVFAK